MEDTPPHTTASTTTPGWKPPGRPGKKIRRRITAQTGNRRRRQSYSDEDDAPLNVVAARLQDVSRK